MVTLKYNLLKFRIFKMTLFWCHKKDIFFEIHCPLFNIGPVILQHFLSCFTKINYKHIVLLKQDYKL